MNLNIYKTINVNLSIIFKGNKNGCAIIYEF